MAVVLEEFGGPERLLPRKVAAPSAGPREILVRVRACGVCRHDVLSRQGILRRGMKLPVILGHEIAGDVVGVGDDVRDWALGDRVATTQRSYICGSCRFCRSGHESLCATRRFLGHEVDGGYAELAVVEADTASRLPDGVSYVHGSIVACAIGTGYNAVCDVAQTKAAERVLVTGAGGGLGIHAVQLARAVGATVFGITTSAAKVEAIREAGADEVVVAAAGAFSARVRELTGDGVDVAIDTVGAMVFTEVRRSMAPCGRIVLVGELGSGAVELNLAMLFRRGLRVLSAVSTSKEQLAKSMALVAKGQIRPIVHSTLPLRDAREAHRLIESGQILGRIVLSPDE